MKKLILIFALVISKITVAQVVVIIDSTGKETIKGAPANYTLSRFVKDTIAVPTYYVIFSPADYRDDNYYSHFKLFSGKVGGSLTEKRIIKPVEIYRDGGTTYIETDIVTFYFLPATGRWEVTPYNSLTFNKKIIRLIEIDL